MPRPLVVLAASLMLVFCAAAGRAQTASFNYTTLSYTPDGGTTTYTTVLNAVSGQNAVGNYYTDAGNDQDSEGTNGVLYNLATAQWSAVEWSGATLNRTQINGIDGNTFVGAYATIAPDSNKHQPKDAWLGTYGFISGDINRSSISNPNVDTHNEQEGTYLTSISLTSPGSGTVVGFYVDDNGINHGFMNQFSGGQPGNYTPIAGNAALKPSDVEGNRIVGSTGDANDNGQFQVGFYYDGANVTLLHAPWAVNPNNPDNFYWTLAGGISGDWIAGTWFDQGNTAHGYLYNVSTQQWLQVNDVPGSQSTSINGIDGNTIVGVWTAPAPGGGNYVNAFVGTTTSVPEPSATGLVLGALAALAVVPGLRLRRQ